MLTSIYSGETFKMARQQFENVADFLDLRPDKRERIFMPKRAIAVTCPIHRDDGTVAVYEGYRVQHHLALGPTKGGTRFAPGVDMGEVGALAIWMSWKCALAGLPYGGGKGGIAVDPSGLSRREFEALSRRYMQELIPFVGPQTDVLAPDMGTDVTIAGEGHGVIAVAIKHLGEDRPGGGVDFQIHAVPLNVAADGDAVALP